jgi:hypothetical protein
MTIKFSSSPDAVEAKFKGILEEQPVSAFRDACKGPSTFDLYA